MGKDNLHQTVDLSQDVKIFIDSSSDDYVPKRSFFYSIDSGKSGGLDNGFPDRNSDFLESILVGSLAVQYQVFKNWDASYFGLFDSQRYLEIDRTDMHEDEYHSVVCGLVEDKCLEDIGYTNENIQKTVEGQSIIVCERYAVESLPSGDSRHSIRSWYSEDWRNNVDDFDNMIEIVNKKYPDYGEDTVSYLKHAAIYPFYIFIMQRDIFFEYSSFLFDCLLDMAVVIDVNTSSQYAVESLNRLSNHLLGIFIEHHKRTKGAEAILYTRSVFFHSTDAPYLYPAYQDNNCAVVFCSSDEYAPLLGVAIQSLVENSSSFNNYDLIILDTGMRESSRMLLRLQVEALANVTLRFLDIELLLKSKNLPSAHHITIGTFGRFLTLDYLIGYDKIVYLDSDLVVNADIAELYDEDVDGFLVAAVRDTAANGWYNIPGHEMYHHMNDVLEIDEPYSYFNAGVLIMNLEELRKVTTCDDLMLEAVDPKWLWLDQDVLNHLCRRRIKHIKQAWNYMAHKEAYSSPESLPENWLPEWLLNSYHEAGLNPKIVHYVGRSTPCFAPEADCYWHFWRYAKKSMFYEPLLKTMMSETVNNEQMSTKDHARSAMRGLKEAIKRKLPFKDS